MEEADDYDIIHFHHDYLHFSIVRRHPVPTVTTLHGRLNVPDVMPHCHEFTDVPLVSISNAQRLPVQWMNRQRTIYHGIPDSHLPFDSDGGDHVVFLGRMTPKKRPDLAIRIAREAGLRIRLAAKVDALDQDWFDTVMKPMLDDPGVEFIGEITESEKGEYSARASSATTCYSAVSSATPNSAAGFDEAVAAAHHARTARRANAAVLGSSNELFSEWLNCSAADAYMLVSDTKQGSYPVAGIPWFSTPFGRDALVTALQCLWTDPSIARGVLGYLAETQAREHDVAREAQPGKILHETRACEMAALGEVPFARYYGTVDATPLFIVLAGAWFERTGERAFLEHLWPNIEAALDWLDTYGDVDGDGFIEYERHTSTGLRNQGWKDSDDCISHADGRLAEVRRHCIS